MVEIRDIKVQDDRLRFRTNLRRIGVILAYEMSKSLAFETTSVTTPLSTISQNVIVEPPVLISIMRAAMPFFDGVLEVFDRSDAGFIGAFRTNDFTTSKKVKVDYIAVGNLDNKTVVIADPMLATGKIYGRLNREFKHIWIAKKR